MEPENLKVWLCVIPGLECDFPEDYSRFLEYLLGKVDHKDKESVVLAYGLYQETRKENYGMRDILRLAQKASDENNTASDLDQEQNIDSEMQKQYPDDQATKVLREKSGAKRCCSVGADSNSVGVGTEWKPGTVRTSQIRTDVVRESGSLFGRWKQRRKERKEEKQRELEREMQMPWDAIFVGENQSDYRAPSHESAEHNRMREETVCPKSQKYIDWYRVKPKRNGAFKSRERGLRKRNEKI